jgi:CheY-like chemotaxis protein
LPTQDFTEAGYAVTTASNGRQALRKVRAERPDLVVLDVRMPEMNGFDVAAVLKKQVVGRSAETRALVDAIAGAIGATVTVEDVDGRVGSSSAPCRRRSSASA